MTTAQPGAPGATLLHVEPQLFVSDLERACRFYVDKLGFEIVFTYGDPTFYAQVRRGGARLNLRRTGRPAFDPEFVRLEGHAISASIALDDAQMLFSEFEQNGVDFEQRLRIEPWGARNFIVRDPDGNQVCFAGPGD